MDEKEFYHSGKTSSGKQRISSVCKECHKEREQIRYQQQHAIFETFKNPCVICGEDRKYVIDFHHRQPEEKEFTVAHWRSRSSEALTAELTKCDPICRNCHAEYHFLHNNFGLDYNTYKHLMLTKSLE